MARLRALVALAALIVAGGLVAVIPATAASAAACSASWQASAVYWGDAQVSHNGHNYRAKWWTQDEAPPGTTGVWEDHGACGGRHHAAATGGTCSYPNWAAGTWYATGAIVRYTNGSYYMAEHDNPGYDPTISTWYWEPYTCGGRATDHPAAHQPGRLRGQRGPVQPDVPGPELLLHVHRAGRRAQRLPGVRHAPAATPSSKQEAAAFLANVSHETGGLVLHRRAEHRELPALLRPQPALRLPGRPVRLLRPRADPAQLELQLQGRRRRARHRPAEQPVPGADRLRRWPGRPASGTGTPRTGRAP